MHLPEYSSMAVADVLTSKGQKISDSHAALNVN